MKAQNLNIPAEYIPYEKVIFCSNVLINVRYFIDDNGFFPLFIGKGAIPKIWIFAKQQAKEPIVVVNNSISKIAMLSVNIDDDNKKLSIVLNDTLKKILILQIDYSSMNAIDIENINLQPIGYNIRGDKGSLNVGETNVSRNTIKNANIFLSVG